MKLSEAIRLNGMMLPQGRGCLSVIDSAAPCAIGGALIAAGICLDNFSDVTVYTPFKQLWPWTKRVIAFCPCYSEGKFPCRRESVVVGIIWHLNDHHEWTRNQIADWVEFVEPSTPVQVEGRAPEQTDQDLCVVNEKVCEV